MPSYDQLFFMSSWLLVIAWALVFFLLLLKINRFGAPQASSLVGVLLICAMMVMFALTYWSFANSSRLGFFGPHLWETMSQSRYLLTVNMALLLGAAVVLAAIKDREFEAIERESRSARDLRVLYHIARQSGQVHDRGVLLSGVLEHVLAAFALPAGWVSVIEGAAGDAATAAGGDGGDGGSEAGTGARTGPRLDLASSCGLDHGARQKVAAWQQGMAATDPRLLKAQPVSALPTCPLPGHVVVIPLVSQGLAVGFMFLHVPPGAVPPGPRDADLLRGIGDVAGLTLAGADAIRRLQRLTVRAERQRIAHEVHDGVTQTLAYLHLRADRAARLLARGDRAGRDAGGTGGDADYDAARAELELVRRGIQKAYGEARNSIDGLYAGPAGVGLETLLRQGLAEFQQRAGITARFDPGPGLHAIEPLDRPDIVYIVQEALNNVRRHSGASEVVLSARTDGGRLAISIRDDGAGFDPARVDPARPGTDTARHWGIAIMRQRALALGGQLDVISQPGRGTEIRLTLPALFAGSDSATGDPSENGPPGGGERR